MSEPARVVNGQYTTANPGLPAFRIPSRIQASRVGLQRQTEYLTAVKFCEVESLDDVRPGYPGHVLDHQRSQLLAPRGVVTGTVIEPPASLEFLLGDYPLLPPPSPTMISPGASRTASSTS